MVQFRVRAQSLGEVAAQLQGVIAVLDSHVAQAASVVSGVVDASWVGEDADKFAEQWEVWNASALTLRASLTTLAVQLGSAEASYTSNESGLQSGFSGRRQVNQGVVSGVAGVSTNVAGGRRYAAEVKEARGEAQLESSGSGGSFIAGGSIAARAAQSQGDNKGSNDTAAAAAQQAEGETDG